MKLLAVDQPKCTAIERFATDEDVGGGVEVVEKIELLVDKGDAGADRLGNRQGETLDAVNADHAAARLGDATHHFHQGRLAGAVLADEPDDLARPHGETDVIKRDHARIDLADVDELRRDRSCPGDPGRTCSGGQAVTASDCKRQAPIRGRRPPPFSERAYLPIICFMLAMKSSTLDWSMTLPGTMMIPSAGTPDLSPSKMLGHQLHALIAPLEGLLDDRADDGTLLDAAQRDRVLVEARP